MVDRSLDQPAKAWRREGGGVGGRKRGLGDPWAQVWGRSGARTLVYLNRRPRPVSGLFFLALKQWKNNPFKMISDTQPLK